jgi:hypothetical protein
MIILSVINCPIIWIITIRQVSFLNNLDNMFWVRSFVNAYLSSYDDSWCNESPYHKDYYMSHYFFA